MRTTLLLTWPAAAALLWLGVGNVASAEPTGRLTHLSAAKLLAMCQSPRTNGPCEAYISGISDGITLTGEAVPKDQRKVCIPDVSGNQLRGAVVGWLSKHPERLSSDVGPAVYDAMTAAFPCAAGAAKP